MKRKGITIWEQHLERFVVAAAVLFFLAFTAWQVLDEPNEVDHPPSGTVAPGEIDGLLREKALVLQARLAPDAEPALDIPDPTPVLGEFQASIEALVSPQASIPPSHRRVVLMTGIDIEQRDVAYHVPTVAAPYDIGAGQFFDAILESELTRVPELQERFSETPYDVTWITPVAYFNLKEVREQFEREGPDGQARIPSSWYRNRVEVVDVKVEREELAVDGSWSSRVTLTVPPGMESLREDLEGDVDRAARDRIRRHLDLEGVQDEIVRPPFYDTANDSWSPPEPRIEAMDQGETMTDEQRIVSRLKKRLRKQMVDRDARIEKLERLGGSMGRSGRSGDEDEGKGGGSGSGSGSGGAGAPPGGGGAGSGGDRRGAGKKRGAPGGGVGFGAGGGGDTGGGGAENEMRKENLKKAIQRLNGKIARDERKLRELLGDEAVLAAAADADDANGDEMKVWAHDLDVEAGRTYRYRFTMELYNPFFAKKLNLLDEQDHLAESIVLVSQTSDWSPPRQAIPDRKVFVTQAYGPAARKAGALGMGKATAEVYRFYHGRWWLDSFALQPGDRVGATQEIRGAPEGGPTSVDFGTSWFVLDIVGDINADRDRADRGLGARVLLQDVLDPAVTRMCDPDAAARDEERDRLRQAVEDADAATADLARAGG